MPAPVPVRIEHGSPVLLSNLAMEAGSASARRRNSDRAYQTYLQQMSQDSAFMRDEMSRRNAPRRMQQTSPTMLSDASGYNRPQTFTNPGGGNAMQQFAMERQQQNGGMGYMPSVDEQVRERGMNAGAGRSGQNTPVSFVPESGAYGQPQPTQPSTITERGSGTTFTRYGNEPVIATQAGATQEDIQGMREMAPEYQQGQQRMVSPRVRQQLDAVRAMQGSIPENQYNSLLTAAGSGEMDMDKLMDDLRQSMPSQSSTRLTAVQRQDEKIQADLQFADYYDQQGPADKTDFMQTQLNWKPTPPTAVDMSTPSRRAEYELKIEQEGAAAYNSWSDARRSIGSSTTLPLTGGQLHSENRAEPGYTIGQTHNGRRYTGGAVNDPNNWEVIQ